MFATAKTTKTKVFKIEYNTSTKNPLSDQTIVLAESLLGTAGIQGFMPACMAILCITGVNEDIDVHGAQLGYQIANTSLDCNKL